MLETTGFDDRDHLAVIGAALAASPALRAGLLPGLASRLAVRPTPEWLRTAHTQGVSEPAEELDFLPLSTDDFTNSGIAAVDHEAFLESFPQRPFRGERLILQALYITGAGVTHDALNQTNINPALYVGAVQVGATQGGMPASAFGPTAFGVRLSMPVAGQGTRIYLPFIAYGIGAGDRIVLSGGIFGRAVR